ncbi:MAG: aminotransferase class III-fold pyridoxal phosphate-dependent enzyme [Rhodospirillales bacterium]
MTVVTQAEWVERARRVLPAGGFGNYDPGIVIRSGHGARVRDEDGNEYVDYLIGSGPMMVGHCHPEVVEAVTDQLSRGTTFFASNAAGIELAEVIVEAMACAEQVRYVSTGSEADMYAMRLARAHTGREKIMKFEGGYHGMSSEGLMSLAPTRLANFPQAVPDSAGIPSAVRDNMVVAPFNDAEMARTLLDEYGADIAGIIVEPLQRLIPPAPGFLEMLRAEATKRGIVLIFDEVVTGFRLGYGGGQEKYGVTPDICTLGKVIGGGFPLAAIAGAADIMAHFDQAKVGDDLHTKQIGTLSGNPVAAVAGLKTLEILRRDGAYDHINACGRAVMAAMDSHLSAAGIPHRVVGEPVMFDAVFIDREMRNYRDGMAANAARTAAFNRLLRERGILKSPGKTYISLALDDTDIDQTVNAIAEAARLLE